MIKRSAARLLLCSLVLGVLSGCVTLPPNAPRSPQDPFERWNRGVYKFNDALDRGVTKPIARGYVKAVPQPIRKGVSNFWANLNMTTVMINDTLQGKLKAAATDLGRFLLNTTVGFGGLLDPATHIGMPHNDEDFGQTLGHWGVHPGPFIELPVLGPSDMRDAPGKLVDVYTNPWEYVRNPWVEWSGYGLYLIDVRTGLLSFDSTIQSAYDPYALIRDTYLKRRAYLVSDGKIKDEEPPLIDPDAPDQPAAPETPKH